MRCYEHHMAANHMMMQPKETSIVHAIMAKIVDNTGLPSALSPDPCTIARIFNGKWFHST